jgi:tRNA G37 N-methylase TrmD
LKVPDVLLSGDHKKVDEWRSDAKHLNEPDKEGPIYTKILKRKLKAQ